MIDRIFPPGGQAGTAVEVTLSGKPGAPPLSLWSSNGKLSAAFSEKNDKVTITIPADCPLGVHWLRFWNPAGSSSLRPFVVGRLPELLEVEPNDRHAEAQAISDGQRVINGVLEKSGDVDTYTVPVSAGQTLFVSVLGKRELSSPMDAVLQVLDEDGAILIQNDDDHGIDPQATFKAERDGILRIRLFSFPSDPNSSIHFAGGANYMYRLTVSTGPAVDYTLPLAIQTGIDTSVELKGWNLNPDGATVPVLAGAPEESRSVPFDSAMPVTVSVINMASLIEGRTIQSNDASHSNGASRSKSAPTVIPAAITGVIHKGGERDHWQFQGERGKNVTVRVEARRRDSLLDPAITIRSQNGAILKEADDLSGTDLDCESTLTIPDDGLFSVEVRDRYAHGGERYFYLLTVTESRPDAKLSIRESVFSGTTDKPLEIPVTIDRTNGYSGVLDFRVEGLPEGVTAAAARSEKEGDSSKAVTLRIEGSTVEAFSGAIRLIARDSETGVVRAATYRPPDSMAEIDTIWLAWPVTQ
ncbi:MAG: PPC domain-containing protein [Planctomyces sp.]|nr:PPC domain-containing protein [Planctomyces sp.]